LIFSTFLRGDVSQRAADAARDEVFAAGVIEPTERALRAVLEPEATPHVKEAPATEETPHEEEKKI